MERLRLTKGAAEAVPAIGPHKGWHLVPKDRSQPEPSASSARSAASPSKRSRVLERKSASIAAPTTGTAVFSANGKNAVADSRPSACRSFARHH